MTIRHGIDIVEVRKSLEAVISDPDAGNVTAFEKVNSQISAVLYSQYLEMTALCGFETCACRQIGWPPDEFPRECDPEFCPYDKCGKHADNCAAGKQPPRLEADFKDE